MRRQLLPSLVGVLVLGGCVPLSGWPPPDPARPVVDLRFDVAQDLRSVVGREHIDFTPDLRVCELVFRAWPNKPATARAGNALEVTEVRVDGTTVAPVVRPAGAPDGHPGTLIEVPLPACVDAGATVRAELSFTLTLGEGTDERMGAGTDVAWFATAFPLLAWERGHGWSTDPAVVVVGETAISETFDLRSLEVAAPSEYAVMGTGAPMGEVPDAVAGTTVHRFADPAVRDVSITVGRLEVVHREVDGVRVHVGAPVGATTTAVSRWADRVMRSVRDVAEHLGPFPYSDLWVSVLPQQTSGIEVTGAIQLGDLDLDEDRWVVTHEVAHMWFYGLVGNDQGTDPWLDEAFATFAQVLADGSADVPGAPVAPALTGRVGAPMDYWEGCRRPSDAYVAGVYTAGGVALVEARRGAGAGDFDAALRAYLARNAHQIAVPADVEEAFAHLPLVLATLREAGALAPVAPLTDGSGPCH
ncbi:M1 family aminopeptidase [Georgenia faecalis]|uniref:M1 family aminopeptidase n=1 Tax=Georgenia faecalis TaxID=2483799 RepID=A0ABV9D830_9MICO|nr:M1 family aminopeptidase [Georgenia faecalis]